MARGKPSDPLIAALLITVFLSVSAVEQQNSRNPAPRESRIPVGKASLYARDIGQGQPITVLHGGPDFDHSYLLPDLDRLADAFRLIYYDQRGRGMSADGVQPDDVTLASDLEDVNRVREHFRLESTALLVITGEQDFIPVVVAEHVARAIPNARLVTIKNCGHFAYLECGGEVRAAIDGLFKK